MANRTIKFTTVYADDLEEIERVECVEIPDGLNDEEIEELLFPLTGTGRTGNVDAGYWAESIDGTEPEINLEWGV